MAEGDDSGGDAAGGGGDSPFSAIRRFVYYLVLFAMVAIGIDAGGKINDGVVCRVIGGAIGALLVAGYHLLPDFPKDDPPKSDEKKD